MKKKILALLMCICFALAIVPFTLSANVSFPDTVIGVGNKVVALESDTGSEKVPDVFGTKEADGLVWTNKTVNVKEEQFEVTLSALAQEYSALVETGETTSTPSDVVMILDVSGSMRNNKLNLDGDSNATRTKAMVKAVNEAMEVIMSANPHNRVMIYIFHTDNDINSLCSELLPLGHYTNPSWGKSGVWNSTTTNAATGKYFDYSGKTTSDKISTASGLLKDGKAISSSATTSSGTCTQQGIVTGVKALTDAIGEEEHTADRLPFVFLFTDGAPGAASRNWYSETPTDRNKTSHYNEGNSEVTALTVLTAALEKDRLSSAYTEYNGKETEAQWFNIGLTVGNNNQGKAFLDPATIKDGSNAVSNDVKNYIETYTSGNYSEYSEYAENYVYAEENVFFVSTGKELTDAFAVFADTVKESSKEIKSPIVSTKGDASAELVFSEVIGEGMAINNIVLKKDSNTSLIGVPTENGNSTTYSFEGMETTVVLSKNDKGQDVLIWKIPAKEVAIYTFKDGVDGYNAAEPMRLKYNVAIANEDEMENNRLYVSSFENATTSATGKNEALTIASFSVSKDNPYYYDVVTDEDGLFVSSEIKASAFATQNKDKNISGTADYLVKPSYTSNNEKTEITNRLGNNGTALAVVALEKTASKDKVNANEEVSFKVKITNLHTDKITGVVVTDTLPQGLTFLSFSGEGVTVANRDNVLTITVEKLEIGESVEVTYTVKVDAMAPTGTVYKNKVVVNSVENTDVTTPGETEAKITVENKFKVTYNWDGDIPQNVTLPKDDNIYITGDRYIVDGEYTNQYLIPSFDSYGNKNGEWRFSGWTDPNNGVMGYADVQLNGLWTYQAIEVPTHNVVYSWSGDLPANKTLPIDKNAYVKGQGYEVDGEYIANMRIDTFDSYGNLSGYYTFSGWADPQNGVMGETDVIVTGQWVYTRENIPSHKVYYEWGTTLPSGVTLPTDSDSYVNNQPYEVDKTYTNKSVIDTFDVYGNVNGQWQFSGWTDPNNGVMGNSDVTVVGEWNYTPIVVPTHKVNYNWGTNLPEGVTLPTDNGSYVNNQPYVIDGVYTAQNTIDTFDAYGNKNGEWQFSGWTDPNNGVMGNSDVTVTGKWTYTPVAVPTHKVIYNWGNVAPNGVILPKDNNGYVYNQPYNVDGEFTNQTLIETFDNYGNKNGEWQFSGWTDPNNGVMGETDVTVTGVWNYTPIVVPTHKVYYEWGTNLPDGVTKPTDNGSYVKNQPYEVDGVYTNKTVIDTFDVYGNKNGQWQFSGWTDPNNGVMGNSDVTVIGEWNYTPVAVPTHKVNYNWGTKVPDGVTLPTDNGSYVNNQPYVIDGAYTAQNTIDTFDAYGNKNGEWRFSGWIDPNNGVMGSSDITVTGKWTYTPVAVPTHKVIYNWGSVAPNGAVLPFDLNEYVSNQPYEVDGKYSAESVIDTFDAYGNKNGKWQFSGWTDPQSGVMGNSDVTIVGVWTYTPVAVPTHKVVYSFNGQVPENVVAPTDDKEYVKGENYLVDSTFTAGKTVEIKDQYGNLSGVYTFFGWEDPNNGVMDEADVTVIGKWEYLEVPVNSYTVTYNWGEKAPKSEKLPIDLNTYVTNQNYSVDQNFTDKTIVYEYDAKGNVNGAWRFSGWTDPQNGVMGTQNVVVVGSWAFTAVEVPKHEVDFDEEIEEIERLEKIKVYPNGGVWYYGGATYKDDQSAVIVVDGDIEILDPTRENFTYEGWEILEEEGYKLVLRAKWMPPVPTTGDNTNTVAIAAVAVIALLLLISLGFALRKKKEK